MRNRDLPPQNLALKPIGFAMAAVVAGLAPAAEAQAAPRAVTRQAEPARAPVAVASPQEISLASEPVAVLSSPPEWAQGDLFKG